MRCGHVIELLYVVTTGQALVPQNRTDIYGPVTITKNPYMVSEASKKLAESIDKNALEIIKHDLIDKNKSGRCDNG